MEDKEKGHGGGVTQELFSTVRYPLDVQTYRERADPKIIT